VFRDWAVELELSVKGAERPRSNLTFLFTDVVCPHASARFRGFRVTVVTAGTDADGLLPVVFSRAGPSGERRVAGVRVWNASGAARLRVRRERGEVTVEALEGGAFAPLLRVSGVSDPYFGYLTFSAEAEGGSDTADLISLRTTATSPYETAQFDAGLPHVNRKIIETDALKRRELKKQRRRGSLPTMDRYTDRILRRDCRLNGEEFDVKDAFSLILEAEQRGFGVATIDQLKVFVKRNLVQAITKAIAKVDLVFERFDEMQTDMGGLWRHLEDELTALGALTKDAMTTIEHECLDAVRRASLEHLGAHSEPARAPGGSMVKALAAVAAVEAVAYIAFCAVQHRKTHGFRKRD